MLTMISHNKTHNYLTAIACTLGALLIGASFFSVYSTLSSSQDQTASIIAATQGSGLPAICSSSDQSEAVRVCCQNLVPIEEATAGVQRPEGFDGRVEHLRGGCGELLGAADSPSGAQDGLDFGILEIFIQLLLAALGSEIQGFMQDGSGGMDQLITSGIFAGIPGFGQQGGMPNLGQMGGIPGFTQTGMPFTYGGTQAPVGGQPGTTSTVGLPPPNLSAPGVCNATIVSRYFPPSEVGAMQCIMQGESSCGANLVSRVDVMRNDPQRRAFSFGPTQINITVHDLPGCGPNGTTLNCPAAFSGRNYSARVVNEALYQQCAVAAQQIDCNLRKARQLRDRRGNFRDWLLVGRRCGLHS